MTKLHFCIRLLPCLLAPALALAQTGTEAVDRSQLFRTQPSLQPAQQPDQNGTALGYAASSENDADLGVQAILKRDNQYRAFTISVGTPYYYTSNVALTKEGQVSDGVFAPVFTFNYQPHLWTTLYGEFAISQQLFYYNDFNNFNFESFDAIAGLVYYLPKLNNLTLRVRYDFNRLTDDDWNEFYANHQILLMAELPFRIGRAMQVSLGAVANFSVSANPGPPRRHEFDFYVGYQVQLSRSFSLDAAATFQVKDYLQGDRTDVGEILALTANYRIRDWLSISSIASAAFNQSDQSVFDYQVYNLGGAVAVNIKF